MPTPADGSVRALRRWIAKCVRLCVFTCVFAFAHAWCISAHRATHALPSRDPTKPNQTKPPRYGGPKWLVPGLSSALPPLERDRRRLLDRYESHTKHCKVRTYMGASAIGGALDCMRGAATGHPRHHLTTQQERRSIPSPLPSYFTITNTNPPTPTSGLPRRADQPRAAPPRHRLPLRHGLLPGAARCVLLASCVFVSDCSGHVSNIPSWAVWKEENINVNRHTYIQLSHTISPLTFQKQGKASTRAWRGGS